MYYVCLTHIKNNFNRVNERRGVWQSVYQFERFMSEEFFVMCRDQLVINYCC